MANSAATNDEDVQIAFQSYDNTLENWAMFFDILYDAHIDTPTTKTVAERVGQFVTTNWASVDDEDAQIYIIALLCMSTYAHYATVRTVIARHSWFRILGSPIMLYCGSGIYMLNKQTTDAFAEQVPVLGFLDQILINQCAWNNFITKPNVIKDGLTALLPLLISVATRMGWLSLLAHIYANETCISCGAKQASTTTDTEPDNDNVVRLGPSTREYRDRGNIEAETRQNIVERIAENGISDGGALVLQHAKRVGNNIYTDNGNVPLGALKASDIAAGDSGCAALVVGYGISVAVASRSACTSRVTRACIIFLPSRVVSFICSHIAWFNSNCNRLTRMLLCTCSTSAYVFPAQAPIGAGTVFPIFEHTTVPPAVMQNNTLRLDTITLPAALYGDEDDQLEYSTPDCAEMRFRGGADVVPHPVHDLNMRILANIPAVYIPDKYIDLRLKYYAARLLVCPYQNPEQIMQLFYFSNTLFTNWQTTTATQYTGKLASPLYGRRIEKIARVFHSTDMYQSTPLFTVCLTQIYDTISQIIPAGSAENKYQVFSRYYGQMPTYWANCLAAKAQLQTVVHNTYKSHDDKMLKMLNGHVSAPFIWLRNELAKQQRQK